MITEDHLKSLIELYGTDNAAKLIKRMRRDIKIIERPVQNNNDTKVELGYARIGADNWK